MNIEYGQRIFFYKVSEDKWELGFDKDGSFSNAEFRAPGRGEEQPPSTGWVLVSEDDKGKDWPDMKVTSLGTIKYTSKLV